MIVESFPENITWWGAVVFWETSKIMLWKHLQTYFTDIVLLISQKLQHLSK